MTEKEQEQMKKIFSNFMERNKDYALEVCIKGLHQNPLGRFFIPMERRYQSDENSMSAISWIQGSIVNIQCKEVAVCCEERERDISETIHFVMESGMLVDISCVVLRI